MSRRLLYPHPTAAEAFFQAPNIGHLAIPIDEPVELEGVVNYKGARHPFRARMQLKRWHKDLGVTSFCVG
jgi:hypothetical protein